jgi:carbonic anhydrase
MRTVKRSVMPCALMGLLVLLGGCHSSRQGEGSLSGESPIVAPPEVQTKESQAAMTPAGALARLEQGNARFVEGRSKVRNLPAKVSATAAGQYPFAVVLSCVDSRQPVELIFDQGIGDLFNARVAGNVLNDDILGSLEFACKVSGSKLIVVLGHSSCGAVKGAIDNVELGHLTGLLDRIKPAIAAVPADSQPRDSKNEEFVQRVAEANVMMTMEQIMTRSPILREMLEQHKIGLVGGMYDVSTGRVRFFPS